MKKVHGPAFNKELIPLKQCPVCRGRAVISGVFHQIDCIQCNASGWVAESTGEALSVSDLVTQLSLMLQQSARAVQEMRRHMPSRGPAGQYEQNNRRGAGGTNLTLD